MKFDFIGSGYQSESLNISAQECTNLYLEKDAATGKPALLGTPGLVSTPFGTLPTTPVRALWAGEGKLFAVGGTKLYEVDSGGTATDKGTVANDGAPAYIYPSGDGTQIFIISGGQAYVHNGVSIASAPVPADDAIDVAYAGGQVGTARSGCFLDSYFIASKEGSTKFFFSDFNNSAAWDEADWSAKQSYPDAINALIADHTELWVYGTHKSTEVWRNEGDEDEAGGFRRDPGAHMHYALVAQHSLVNLDGPAFLGGDTRGRIAAYRTQGFQAVRVSTHAVEKAWSAYSTVSDAISWVQDYDGHRFWWITFPTGNATWVYDMTTNLWHRRTYWNGSSHDRHRARCGAFAFGKHLVGDHTTGVIHELSRTAYTDAGTTIRRVRSAPHVSDELKRIFYSRFELECEVTTEQAPDIILDWSNDGGHSFQTARTIQPSLASRQGRLIANRLGSSHRPRVYRVTITDAVRVALVDAYLEATAGVR